MTELNQSNRERGERSGLAAMMVVLIVAMPLLYLLSTGPIIWLESRGYTHPTADAVLRVIYAQVRYLLESSEACERVFKLWADLWGK